LHHTVFLDSIGEFPRAIQMTSRSLLHPDLLITSVQSLDDIIQAFEQVDREEPSTIKIVLDITDV
jgi:threonine dehydrogenase-like Zn-dependent dehydrogenase